MIIYAEVECKLYDGQSIKDKRSVVKRMIAKLRKDYNVSIAELDYLDLWQRIKFGIVTVSNDLVHAEKVMNDVLRVIDSYPELERTITNLERL